MNKIFLFFCALTVLSSCAKKESPLDDQPAYSDYRVVEVQNGGTITGQVHRTDSATYLERVSIQRDQAVCGVSHPNASAPGKSGVRGCVVWLEGIREGKAFAFEKSPKLEQRACEFLPHIQVIAAGTPMVVTNDDAALHNYHVTLGSETIANEAQPEGSPPHELTLRKKGLHSVACDVHPWMKAMIMVADHPYYAVTDSSGAFTIANIPPGEYKLKLWRDDWRIEELKNSEGRIVSYKWKPDLTKETKVTVEAGKSVATEFSLP